MFVFVRVRACVEERKGGKDKEQTKEEDEQHCTPHPLQDGKV